MGATIVVEVEAAIAALVPAVEAPQIKVGRAEMVVDEVKNDGDATRVRRLDEARERVRAAVGALDRERMGRVVAPTHLAGELERRHHLDRVHAEPGEMVEPLDRPVEGAGAVLVRRERRDVQLVQDEIVPAGGREIVVAPVDLRGIEDDCVAARVRQLTGERVDPP